MCPSDDPLAGLLSGVRRPKKQADDDLNFGRSPKASAATGLNPLDILALPASQRDAINWLSRRKQATFSDLQTALNKSPAELSEILEKLKSAGYIREALIDNTIYYRVVFGGKVNRTGRGIPQNIWDAVDVDAKLFLKQLPLFAHLAPDTLQTLASQCESRQYHRNEVIVWQGDTTHNILFIKNGIVGITRLAPQSQDAQMLAYLKQGDMLGEMSLFMEQSAVSNATATALSEVSVLAIKRDAFRDYLKQDRQAALELSRILLLRLQETNSRLVSINEDSRLALLFSIGDCGATMFGTALAMTLSAITQNRTVYAEYPHLSPLLQTAFQLDPQQAAHRQKAGYDIATPQASLGLPDTVRSTLVLDELTTDYTNLVIGVGGQLDETISPFLEEVNQLIVIFTPEKELFDPLQDLVTRLKANFHPEKTNIFMVANHTRPHQSLADAPLRVDFEIPYFGNNTTPSTAITTDQLPPAVYKVTEMLADRLGRTNQIGIYIPSVLDDPHLNPSDFVQETLSFLGSIFGGATASTTETQSPATNDANFSQSLHVVRTYVTKVDLDRYLSKVLQYIEQLKLRLGQEALALEVNNKLMVI